VVNKSVLQSSIKRVYKRGYKGFNRAMEQPNSENLHEWRKRVKYLWYHLRILKPIWPNLMKAFAKETHQLADYLGDDHDLAVLRNLLSNQPDSIRNNPNYNELLGCLKGRRAQLQFKAKYLGKRIYSESPDTFIERLDTYWQTWQQETS
jgi:CHAD domain-containing protein